jgi:hypothetical protein
MGGWRVTGPDREQQDERAAARRRDRLRQANTLRRLGRLHSALGHARAAEEAFAAALRIYDELGDAHSFVVALVQRGRHRLEAGEPAGGADWGTAVALALGIDPDLAQQVVATAGGWARARCLAGQDDRLLSAALATLIETGEATASGQPLAERELATLAVVLNAFRVIGAICAYHDGADAQEAAAYAAVARAGAAEVDQLTSGAFALADLVARRLPQP